MKISLALLILLTALTAQNLHAEETCRTLLTPKTLAEFNYLPRLASTEEALFQAKGFRAEDTANLDRVNQYIQFVREMRKHDIDFERTHIEFFSSLIPQHLAHVRKGIGSKLYTPKWKKELAKLRKLRAQAQKRRSSKTVTLTWWLRFNYELTSLASAHRNPLAPFDWGGMDLMDFLIRELEYKFALPIVGGLGYLAISRGLEHNLHLLGIEGANGVADGINGAPRDLFVHDFIHSTRFPRRIHRDTSSLHKRAMEKLLTLPFEEQSMVRLMHFVLFHEREGYHDRNRGRTRTLQLPLPYGAPYGVLPQHNLGGNISSFYSFLTRVTPNRLGDILEDSLDLTSPETVGLFINRAQRLYSSLLLKTNREIVDDIANADSFIEHIAHYGKVWGKYNAMDFFKLDPSPTQTNRFFVALGEKQPKRDLLEVLSDYRQAPQSVIEDVQFMFEALFPDYGKGELTVEANERFLNQMQTMKDFLDAIPVYGRTWAIYNISQASESVNNSSDYNEGFLNYMNAVGMKSVNELILRARNLSSERFSNLNPTRHREVAWMFIAKADNFFALNPGPEEKAQFFSFFPKYINQEIVMKAMKHVRSVRDFIHLISLPHSLDRNSLVRLALDVFHKTKPTRKERAELATLVENDPVLQREVLEN